MNHAKQSNQCTHKTEHARKQQLISFICGKKYTYELIDLLKVT